MSYLENLTRNFADDITRNRRYNYSHDSLEEYLLAHCDVGCATFKIKNKRDQQIETMLLKSRRSNVCIVYAHGLGSNKLEVLSIAKYFNKEGYDICAFDFSSSGRSEGQYTSYGLLEQDDVDAVLNFLDGNYAYEKYVLWGRSMGSVAVVLSQGQSANKKVECLILDSPFSSFQRVAIQIASKKSFIPQFMLELLLEPLKKYFQSQHPINPFQIDILGRVKKIQCKMLIVYSRLDSIINYQHSLDLSKHCKKTPIIIEIKEDHNMQRSRSTHQQILRFIENCKQEAERKIMLKSKNRGISVTSKGSKEREIVPKSCHKLRLTSSVASSIQKDHNDRSIRTIASLNESIQFSKRFDTELSPKRKKVGTIASLYFESRQANKENVKPSLNMMRKNRFR